MYGLPKNIDLSFLVGRELLQVCIGSNDLILHFDDRVSILITSNCHWKSISGVGVEIDSYAESANMICRPLGSKILNATSDESGTLSMKFSNGDAFMLFDDSQQFESYVIECPDRRIVV